MKGRWAAGIVPRNFAWIVKDRLAVSERPGGYAPHHRPVRRQEEILWLSAQGFTRVVSLLPSTHNLHAYEDLRLPASHFPLPAQEDVREVLAELYPSLLSWLRKSERLLVHQEELGERVAGVMAGFLYWSGILAEPPQAISAIEQLLRRQLGSAGRAIVAQSMELSPPLDEYGLPLARRKVVIEASLLGVAPTGPVSMDQVPTGRQPEEGLKTAAKSTKDKRPDKSAAAPRPTGKVAAIQPITKATKVSTPTTAPAKGAVRAVAKKRAPSPDEKKADKVPEASKGGH